MDAYRIVKQIGKGSYGQVYLVKHNSTKKQYVVKKIKLTASSAKERLAAEQEAALLSRLHHPNIVSYKESFQDRHGILHIVMGYCEGGDLCTRLKSYGGKLLPETQVVEWFVQIALALQYLHDRKILHRDLKTQNIFLSKNDIIKVGDLGIARVLDGSCELANTVIGTPYYMSPELFSNQPYNHKSDIWALGCCVYEMATLKHAFTARNINALMYKILQGKVPPLPPKFSGDLSELVQVMMASNAEDRPGVHQILRMPFVREHIKMFLDRTASRRKRAGSNQLKPPAPTRRSCGKERSESSSSADGCDGATVRRRSSSASAGSSAASSRETGDDEMGRREGKGGSLSQLPQLPQQEKEGKRSEEGEEKEMEKEKETEREQREKKVPRPLPPSPPIQKALSSPSHESRHTDKPTANGHSNNKPPAHADSKPHPPGVKINVSSARERRRRTKQEGGRGRVVLKSRSAADLCKKEESGATSTPPGRRREEGGDVPGPSPPVDSENTSDTGHVIDKGREEDERRSHGPCFEIGVDEPDSGEPEDVMQRGSGEEERVKEPHPPPAQCRGAEGGNARVPPLNGHSSDEVEVEEFFNLLDTTLHLPESPISPAHLDSEDHPGPPLKAFSTEHQVSNEQRLPPGRLADRIMALKEECVRCLGEPLLREACLLLDRTDPEEAEEAMLRLLGEEKAFALTGKLQQLKLCQDSLYDL